MSNQVFESLFRERVDILRGSIFLYFYRSIL